MKIEDMMYIQRGERQEGLVMPGGYWVKKQTFLLAYTTIYANWSSIDWSGKQTAKSMLGTAWGDPAVWGYNQALGRCVKYLVTHDMLPQPLEVARKRNGEPYKRGSTKYVLRDSNQTQASIAITARSTMRLGSVDPRTIRINPKIPLPAAAIKTGI